MPLCHPLPRTGYARYVSVMCGLLGVLCWHSIAHAWGYVEHYALGKESYAEVCDDLLKPWFTDTLNPSQRLRLNMACELPSLYSNQYGQFTALSGDHLDADNVRGTKSDIAAKNFVEYLIRAVDDADHFHPAAPLKWREYHEQALVKGLQAAKVKPYLEQVDAFWLAFYLNAFADHFLQDSFAAGHSGFNRPSSTPSASYDLHRYLNQRGKLLRDSAGREWLTFGDDHLEIYENAEGRKRALSEAKASVRDFLVVFVTGKRWRVLERDAALGLPVLADEDCEPGLAEVFGYQAAPLNADIDAAFEAERTRVLVTADDGRVALFAPVAPQPIYRFARCGTWRSLLQVQEPASYQVTHTAGVTQFGRVDHLEHVLAPSYSFGIYARGLRLGLDLGWYMSTRKQGNAGVLLGPTASLPLGGKYGSVLAWDLDLKVLSLLPVTTYHGTEFVQHWAPSMGLGMSIQLGIVNFRASAGPSLVVSNRLGVGEDNWSDHAGLGWYGQFGVHFTLSPGGGGPMKPWPL